MPYKQGDMVIYVEPCSDHRNSPLVLGEVYQVARSSTAIALSKNGRHLWWVLEDSIVPVDQKDYKAQAVIRKIKEIDQRRKGMGYVF